jgi:WD40 repeat protein
VAAGTLRTSFQADRETLWSVDLSPDGRTLATAGSEKMVRLWDLATGWRVGGPAGHAQEVRWVGFGPDGRTLASAGTDNLVRVWDLAAGQEKRRLAGHENWVVSGAWRADGRLLVTAGVYDGTVRLWDLSGTGPRSRALPVVPPDGGWLHALALTPEGRHVVTANPNGTLYVLRLAKRGEVLELPEPGRRPAD